MPTIPEKIPKGVDTVSGKTGVQEGKCEVMENLRPRSTGKLETRKGVRTHAGVSPSGTSNPIQGVGVYRSEVEEYPICISDGKVYARSAGMASTAVNIEGDVTSDFSLGPAFHNDGIDPATSKRLSGSLLGSNISGNKAVITNASYDDSLSQATYTILVEDATYNSPATAIGDIFSTTTVNDWVTITQMGYSEYNGTFEIVSVSEVISGGDSTITLVVSNAQGDNTTPSEADCGAWVEAATDVLELADIGTIEDGDEIVGVYDDTEATLKSLNNTVTVRSSSGNTVAFNIYEDEFEDDDGSPGGLHIQGKRTTTEIEVASISGFTSGNPVSIGSYNRNFRSGTVSGTSIVIDEAIIITHGDAVTEPYFWDSVTVPGGDGGLVPSAPTRILPEAPSARVRTASLQDSIYMANGTDNIQKFDGTNVYRAGMPDWSVESNIYVNPDQSGIVIPSYTYLSIDTSKSEITFSPNSKFTVGDVIVHAETRRRYTVTEVRLETSSIVVRVTSSAQLPSEDLTFNSSTDINNAPDSIDWVDHGMAENSPLLFSKDSGSVADGLSDTLTYYVNVWTKDEIRLKSSVDSTSVEDLSTTSGGAGHTLTATYTKLFYKETTYSHYYRFNMIDVNNNIIASRVMGFGDLVVNMGASGAIVHCLTMPPGLDNYDFDRLEIEVYRTKAVNAGTAPFYRTQVRVIPFNLYESQLVIIDTAPDISLGDGDLDSVMVATKGANLLTAGSNGFVPKYLTTSNNRLIAANIKSNDILDLAFNKLTFDNTQNTLADTTIDIVKGVHTFSAEIKDFFTEFDPEIYASSASIINDGGFAKIDLNYVSHEVAISNFKEGYPVYGISGSTGITPNTRYYIRNVEVTSTTYYFFLSETPNGELVPYTTATLGSGRLYVGNPSGDIELHSVVNSPSTATFSDSGGNLLVTAAYMDFQTGDRIKFEAASGGVLPTGIDDDTIYTVTRVGTSTATLVDPEGNTVTHTDNGSGTLYPISLSSFFFESSGVSTGSWVEIRSYYREITALDTPGQLFRDLGASAGVDYNEGKFNGFWKIAIASSGWCKVRTEHGVEDRLGTGNTAICWIAVGSSSTIPIIADTQLFTDSRFNEQTNSYAVSDIFRTIQSIGRAFNKYQSEGYRWGSALFGSTFGTDRLRFTAANSSQELSIEVTPGNSSYFDTYINGVKQTTGTGQKRLFPSRIIRSYENFPEIFDDPFAESQGGSDSVIDLNPGDGQEITGLAPFITTTSTTDSQLEETVIATKHSDVYSVNIRTKDWSKVPGAKAGCTSPDSIATTPVGVFFANDQGIYRVTRNMNVEYIGEDLEDLWKDVDKDQIAKAVGVMDPHDKCYKLAVPSADGDVTNTKIFCYDYEMEQKSGGQLRGGWFVYTITGVNCMVSSTTDFFMGTEGGDVLQTRQDSDSDGGDYQDSSAEGIEGKLITRCNDFGDAGVRKKVIKVIVDFDLDDTDLTDVLLKSAINSGDVFRSSGATSMTKTNTSSLDQQQAPSVSWSPAIRNCQRVQVEITHSTRKEKLVITGLVYNVRGLSDRGIRQSSDGDS